MVARSSAGETAPAPSVGLTTAATGPKTGETTVLIERPRPGLARGRYAFPAWGIAVIGAGVVALGLFLVAFRSRKSRRG